MRKEIIMWKAVTPLQGAYMYAMLFSSFIIQRVVIERAFLRAICPNH